MSRPSTNEGQMHADRTSTRFSVPVDAALRSAGWQPGHWDIKQAEYWADALRGHESPAGHRHAVFPAAVEAWAEFGGLRIRPTGTGRQLAPTAIHLDPLHGLHMARTLGDLGRALDAEVCPSARSPTPAPSSPSTPRAASTHSTTPATGTWAPRSTPPSPPSCQA